MGNQMHGERAVVVTGASRGIGEACALHLDRAGFKVFAGVRQAAHGDALKRKASHRLTPILLDVTDAASIASAVEVVTASVEHAGLAGLVNNAGIAVAGPLEFLSIDTIRQQFEVNVIGQIAVTQAFLPLLREGNGRVVNMGSMEGRLAMPFVGAYCASKFALQALTQSLRMELRSWGISVSIIEPGTIATPILEKSIAAAEESVRGFPDRAHDLYDSPITAARQAADRILKSAIPTDAVAKAVTHALTAKRPKTRYIVGRDARLMALLARFVPDRVSDWLIVRQMGLHKAAQCSRQTAPRPKKEGAMRVLITGGAGRLGLSVCNAFLHDGFQLRVFDLDTEQNRKTVKQLAPDAEVFWGDMTRPDSVRQAMEGVDAVVHMAAILPPVADENPQLAAKVNVGGTATLLELLREKGGRVPFVFTSSVAVFGPSPDASGPINPDHNEPRPKGSYAETKFQAETLIRESGVDHAILRLTATMYLVFATSDLKRMYTVPLDNRIEFCHPDDTATAILNAIKNFDQVKGRTLVISGGPAQRMLYKDMIRRIMGVMGLPVPPARKFTQEPYYLDWYDTAESQELLRYQRRTFADYLRDYSGGLARQYSALFIPFMLYFGGPLFGRIITHLM